MKIFNKILIDFEDGSPLRENYEKGSLFLSAMIDMEDDDIWQRHIKTFGTVYPAEYGFKGRAATGAKNFPAPGVNDEPEEYVFLHDIVLDVQGGDKVYFDTFGLRDAIGDQETYQVDGKKLYGLPYNFIICVVRDEKIIPIGGQVLITPDIEDWEEILIPVYSDNLLDENGRRQLKPKDQWIQTKVEPEARIQRGWVAHIGEPLVGQEQILQVGDYVIYEKNAQHLAVQVEGEDYYYIHHKYIYAVDAAKRLDTV